MRKNKSELYLAIFIVAVIASTAFLYIQTQEKNTYGIFPEKLGDMTIALYREGRPALAEVKSLHRGADIQIENAYIADYRSSNGNKVKFWVSESKNSDNAELLVELMNSRVGKTGMFSESTPSTIENIKVYFVTGLGDFHYFWARDNRVFWVQINNADPDYQVSIVKETIRVIT
jgi:hypothetical protein